MVRMQQTLGLIGVVALLAGCGDRPQPSENESSPAAASQADAPAHSHGAGPHGGAVADWGGGEYHVEFTVDHDARQATVYVLGGDAKSPAPIGAESLQLSISEPVFQVDLAPAPQAGDDAAASSRFVGQHENLGVVREFSGTISGEVGAIPYAGDFSEEPHD